jgi:hypothetical protein
MALGRTLFEQILIDPASAGADSLRIVSGYASPAMAYHHAEALKAIHRAVSVELIVGMCAQEGLGESQHLGFRQMMETDLVDRFNCSYLTALPPVHSKVYVWRRGSVPIAAFVGSANYTQAAFKGRLREFMVPADLRACSDYFDSLVPQTIYCNHQDADGEIIVYNDQQFEYRQRMGRLTQDTVSAPGNETAGLPSVTISLLDRSGDLPQRSGLNWGQRPELNREPNQAYIRVPLEIARTDFFPPRGEHFTLLTDDHKVLICTRAQDGGKAIEGPKDNSLLGEYFRRRLGLADGATVTKEDLLRHGRTDLTFYKVDTETYNLDFSPEPPEGTSP